MGLGAVDVWFPMQLTKAAVVYFLFVFGAGFCLGPIRIFWLVPKVGTRIAELIEMPFMLTAIFFSARFINGRLPLGGAKKLAVGFGALAITLIAEGSLAGVLRGISVKEAFFDRDPVSGSAYYLMLLVFALMPWILAKGKRV